MSDVIYTAADGKQYKAVPDGPDNYLCSDCAFWDNSDCIHSKNTLNCITAKIIWQPITIQKPTDNFNQWLQEMPKCFVRFLSAWKGRGCNNSH